MFFALRKVSFSAQLGPYESFAELQAAAGREIPDAILVTHGANLTQGPIRNSTGSDIGTWNAPPFTLHHQVSLTACTGPSDTIEELEIALCKEVPGAKVLPPVKHFLENEHMGNVADSSGNVIGHWYEGR